MTAGLSHTVLPQGGAVIVISSFLSTRTEDFAGMDLDLHCDNELSKDSYSQEAADK